MLSKNLDECIDKVENTINEQCKSLDPELLCNLICGIKLEVIRAYSLGLSEGFSIRKE